MKSIWEQDVQIPSRESLKSDIQTKVAVVGAGMAGALIGYFLKKRGISCVILEANRIGSGQTGHTTAKITLQHGLIYDGLIRNFGEEKASQYAEANRRTIDEYRRIIKEEQVDCMFEERSAFLYSCGDTELLEKELSAAHRLGIQAEITKETDLPFEIAGALKFNGQAQFHPLKFLQAITEQLEIYENTRVMELLENELLTEHGKVTAEKIVIASHFPFINTPGYYFMRMHQERSYVLALENAPQLSGMYLGIDEDGLSFRSSGGFLLMGGGGHRTGENSVSGKYEELRRAAKKYFPESREAAHWSAQDCIPMDDVPYIGQFSSSTPDVYVATGFQKWGMTSSMVSAMAISELIAGNAHPYPVFSPQRFHLSASAKQLVQDGIKAVKGISAELFSIPAEQEKELLCGHGGIVECESKKMGVYKNEDGEVFVVSVRCPHLGCQLEWNPDELSWDCPCHGSRFDYTGKLLDNPAQNDLD
ncbi:MAG: FAD-dependent oxidoreductase [Oscillospiraceae bacterium]